MRISYRPSNSFNIYNYNGESVRHKPSFGIANSGKLKTMFTYGLPCMYTGVDMIDPRKVQRLINNNAFDGTVSEVLSKLKPFERSITDIESEVYKIITSASKRYPDKSLQTVLKIISPQYKTQLKSEQEPVLERIAQVAQNLPEKYKTEFNRLMEETDNKINETPVLIPFSSFEFQYKLDKIKKDITQNCSPKARRAIEKMLREASLLSEETNSETIAQQKKIIRFIKIILRTSALKNNEKLKTLVEDSEKRLNNQKVLVPFSRKIFIYDLDNLIKTLPDIELRSQLLDLAISLPSSRNSISAYIMKFSREPSWKIAYRLLWPNMASVEHILPQSKGGEDAMYNFGGAGTRVNADRGNLDFKELIELHPEYKSNMQKYVNALIRLVKHGIFNRVGEKSNYIDDFCRTVYIQSGGLIKLNTHELQVHRQKGSVLLGILESLNLH